MCTCVYVYVCEYETCTSRSFRGRLLRERGSENEKREMLGSGGLAHVISYAKHVPGLRPGATFLLHTSGPQGEPWMSLDPMCLCGM